MKRIAVHPSSPASFLGALAVASIGIVGSSCFFLPDGTHVLGESKPYPQSDSEKPDVTEAEFGSATWNFSSDSGLSFDSNLIEVVGGSARLVGPAYSTADPTLTLTSGIQYSSMVILTSFEAVTGTGHAGAIRFQISGDGSDWYYHDGSAWVSAGSSYLETNTDAEVRARLSEFAPNGETSGRFHFRAFFHSDGVQPVVLDSVEFSLYLK